MYYNINEKEFMEIIDKYDDKLEKVAKFYNDFKEDTDDILLQLNQQLKKFPIIDSWRIEICFLWDQCRLSLVSALAAYNMYEKFGEEEFSQEKVHALFKSEYFLENVTYRFFSILEKIGHLINNLMDLGLKEKQVSFYKVKNIIEENHQDSKLYEIIDNFNKSDVNNQKLKDFRNALTHRKDPFQPYYELKDSEVIVEDKESDLFGKTLSFNLAEQTAPKFELETMLDTTTKFHVNLTEFIDKLLFHSLSILIKRYEDEVNYYEGSINKN